MVIFIVWIAFVPLQRKTKVNLVEKYVRSIGEDIQDLQTWTIYEKQGKNTKI